MEDWLIIWWFTLGVVFVIVLCYIGLKEVFTWAWAHTHHVSVPFMTNSSCKFQCEWWLKLSASTASICVPTPWFEDIPAHLHRPLKCKSPRCTFFYMVQPGESILFCLAFQRRWILKHLLSVCTSIFGFDTISNNRCTLIETCHFVEWCIMYIGILDCIHVAHCQH